MTTHVESLLIATLSPYADYKTKQLIKAGDLGQAAINILKAHRKALMHQNISFFVMTSVAILLHLFTSIFLFANSTGLKYLGLEMLSFIALLQVPGMIANKAFITRLETVLIMWLLEDPDTRTEADPLLAQLLAQP